MAQIHQTIVSGELDENLLYHIDELEKMRASYGAQDTPNTTMDLLWERLELITRPIIQK